MGSIKVFFFHENCGESLKFFLVTFLLSNLWTALKFFSSKPRAEPDVTFYGEFCAGLRLSMRVDRLACVGPFVLCGQDMDLQSSFSFLYASFMVDVLHQGLSILQPVKTTEVSWLAFKHIPLEQ